MDSNLTVDFPNPKFGGHGFEHVLANPAVVGTFELALDGRDDDVFN